MRVRNGRWFCSRELKGAKMTQEEIAVNAMKGILSGLAAGGPYINPDDVTRKADQVATAMKRR
tara:strand:+ start:288 stop:476 length:189 start_codon:yes stop_codon:yes gene_type:complete